MKGLVSIIVTNHNREAYIVPCLQSLVAQSYPHLEIIVVDDHSSDNSREAIRRWRKSLPSHWRRRIYLVSLPRNAGYSGAVTIGMFLARGEYIAMQDGDDVSHRDRIRKQVEFLKKHRGLGAVGTNYRVIDRHSRDPQRETRRSAQTATWIAYGERRIRAVFAQGGHAVSVPTLLFKARYFDRYGGLTNRLHGAEDYEFIAILMKHGVRIDNLRDILYYYRKHDAQRSIKFYG